MTEWREHNYKSNLIWTGAGTQGTKNYVSYDRDYEIHIEGKPIILGSSDPMFRGNPDVHNPEDMFLASVSACHMLWFLHICSTNRIVVSAYNDHAEGTMHDGADGAGQFTSITLHPHATIEHKSDLRKAHEAHVEANKKCFIANSLNFPVKHKATFECLDD